MTQKIAATITIAVGAAMAILAALGVDNVVVGVVLGAVTAVLGVWFHPSIPVGPTVGEDPPAG